jgi:ubiquinone/menaquinone biosynthesis C-methylase UbiE
MHSDARTRWQDRSQEAAIERLYGHRDEAADSHGGFLNFGLWDEGVTDYLDAARRMVRRMGELLGLAPGARVVDAACGTGAQDVCLIQAFGPLEIDAVDVTWAHVALARRRAAAEVAAPAALRVHHASATTLPFPDGSFTHALSLEAAHHFDTRFAFLREARRVLAPGGVIALADFVLTRAPRNALEQALFDATCRLWKVPRDNADTAEAYAGKLRAAGFDRITMEHVGGRTFPGYVASQRTMARRRELLGIRGPVGVAVGETMNWAALKVWQTGLVDYVLVRAERA